MPQEGALMSKKLDKPTLEHVLESLRLMKKGATESAMVRAELHDRDLTKALLNPDTCRAGIHDAIKMVEGMMEERDIDTSCPQPPPKPEPESATIEQVLELVTLRMKLYARQSYRMKEMRELREAQAEACSGIREAVRQGMEGEPGGCPGYAHDATGKQSIERRITELKKQVKDNPLPYLEDDNG
jgi:hypothetical protein